MDAHELARVAEREQQLRAPLQPLGHEAALLLQFPQRAVSHRLAGVELAAEPIPLANPKTALLHAEQELALAFVRAEALDERVVLDAADRLDAGLARAPPDLVVERRVGGERQHRVGGGAGVGVGGHDAGARVVRTCLARSACR